MCIGPAIYCANIPHRKLMCIKERFNFSFWQATILGNIAVGDGSQVASGSLVLKPVPPHTMVAGSPAKVIGKVLGNPALRMEHWSRIPGSIEYLWQEVYPQPPNELQHAPNGLP